MTTPVIHPLTVGPVERGTRLVTVHCPFCGAEHAHGWPTVIPGAPGLYRSHCRRLDTRSTYFITTPEETTRSTP